jgi:hypothetical protein
MEIIIATRIDNNPSKTAQFPLGCLQLRNPITVTLLIIELIPINTRLKDISHIQIEKFKRGVQLNITPTFSIKLKKTINKAMSCLKRTRFSVSSKG